MLWKSEGYRSSFKLEGAKAIAQPAEHKAQRNGIVLRPRGAPEAISQGRAGGQGSLVAPRSSHTGQGWAGG